MMEPAGEVEWAEQTHQLGQQNAVLLRHTTFCCRLWAVLASLGTKAFKSQKCILSICFFVSFGKSDYE